VKKQIIVYEVFYIENVKNDISYHKDNIPPGRIESKDASYNMDSWVVSPVVHAHRVQIYNISHRNRYPFLNNFDRVRSYT
jgi:hypothetical protein